jgi:hypothetical protein
MIVVMPNAYWDELASLDLAGPRIAAPPGVGSSGPPRPVAPERANETDIVGDLIPFVDKHFRTIADRENRALAGLSMGHPAVPGLSNYSLTPPAPLSSRGYHAMPGLYGSIVPPQHHGYGYRKQLKSGQERSSVPRARHNIAWPHEAFDTVMGQRSFSYAELTAPALAAGCLAMLFPTPEFQQTPEPIQVYLEHLSVLFHSLAFSDNLQAVLDYHASVLRLVESGSLTWSRSHSGLLDSLRVNFLALLRSSKQTTGPAAPKTAKPKDTKRAEASKICCSDFGSGKCSKAADHDAVRHICWACFVYRGTEALHGSSVCPFKKS